MRRIEKKYCIYIIFFLFLLISYGCAGPLKINYNPGKVPDTVRSKKPLTIILKPYRDSRDGVGPHYIGKIMSPVSDLHSDELILEGDVATFVTDAIRTHLTASGFRVREWTPEQKSPDIVGLLIEGEIKRFSLDIGPRDEIEIEIENKATELGTGKVIWKGTVTEKNDRYAGVMGNSRRTIGAYISKILSRVINKTISELNANIPNIQGATRTEATPESAGVVDTVMPEGTGRLIITTKPLRSGVYIGDVYYGLSPLSLDLEPGIYGISIMLKGFKKVEEKVSVRRGDTTEMEVIMEKE
jgi:hypothetical protein